MMTGTSTTSGVNPWLQASWMWSTEFERLPTYSVFESVRKARDVRFRSSATTPLSQTGLMYPVLCFSPKWIFMATKSSSAILSLNPMAR